MKIIRSPDARKSTRILQQEAAIVLITPRMQALSLPFQLDSWFLWQSRTWVHFFPADLRTTVLIKVEASFTPENEKLILLLSCFFFLSLSFPRIFFHRLLSVSPLGMFPSDYNHFKWAPGSSTLYCKFPSHILSPSLLSVQPAWPPFCLPGEKFETSRTKEIELELRLMPVLLMQWWFRLHFHLLLQKPDEGPSLLAKLPRHLKQQSEI